MTTIDQATNRDGYDAWAAFYDRYPNPLVFADERAFPPLWAHVRDQRVLEIGCGTGRHTLRLVAQGNDITGLDQSPGMLAAARAKPELASVRFVEGDVLDPNVAADLVVDVVISSLVLEHIADLRAFFRRVRALLAPGGTAYFSEIHPIRADAGRFAHFRAPEGRGDVRLSSVAHSVDDFVAAIAGAGLRVTRRVEFLAPMSMARATPDWARYVGTPMLLMWQVSTF